MIYREKRGDESDGTNRGQGRGKAKESGKKCPGGTSPTPRTESFIYPFFLLEKKSGINRGSFNNISG